MAHKCDHIQTIPGTFGPASAIADWTISYDPVQSATCCGLCYVLVEDIPMEELLYVLANVESKYVQPIKQEIERRLDQPSKSS